MYQRILVPIDGSPTSRRGLQEAMAVAKLTNASVRLIHVVDQLPFTLSLDPTTAWTGDMYTMLREAGQAIVNEGKAQLNAAGVPGDIALKDTLEGRVCDLVLEEAAHWGADLIVIGTHGRRGPGRLLLGSDAEQILRLAPVPVLLVRLSGPATP